MWYDGLFEKMEALRDDAQAQKMSAYMQNRFPFLGLPKPALEKISKPVLRESRRLPFDWDFVFMCWEKPCREAQYVGVAYVQMHEQQLSKEDMINLKRLITEKSWWETVDSLDAICGTLVTKYPELKATMLDWSRADNLWLRRTAIDFQQRFKEDTDARLLEQIIVNNLHSNEFFINKAIGWSLREYSKVNAPWVRDFLIRYTNELSALSRKEASKYLEA